MANQEEYVTIKVKKSKLRYEEELEKLMLKNYLALDEGYIFGTNGSGFERWNLALPKKLLADALDRLYTAVNSL